MARTLDMRHSLCRSSRGSVYCGTMALPIFMALPLISSLQPAAICGGRNEFLLSARLDNLVSCFLATEALALHVNDPEKTPEAERDIALIALFDHEEIGSGSAVGAGSPIMGEAVRRISGALSCPPAATGPPLSNAAADDLFAATVSRSFVLSADMAHAVHPNYAAKHEKGHGPKMNQGLVIKSNSNQRYATRPDSRGRLIEQSRAGSAYVLNIENRAFPCRYACPVTFPCCDHPAVVFYACNTNRRV